MYYKCDGKRTKRSKIFFHSINHTCTNENTVYRKSSMEGFRFYYLGTYVVIFRTPTRASRAKVKNRGGKRWEESLGHIFTLDLCVIRTRLFGVAHNGRSDLMYSILRTTPARPRASQPQDAYRVSTVDVDHHDPP